MARRSSTSRWSNRSRAARYSPDSPGNLVSIASPLVEGRIAKTGAGLKTHRDCPGTARVPPYHPVSVAVAIASGLGKDVAGKPLLRDVAFKVERGERLALSGRNGSGKTTLLRMLARETSLDAGELSLEKGARGGLHHHRPPREQDLSLREYVLSGCGDLIDLEERLGRLEQQMGSGSTGQATLDDYAAAQARFEHAGGYDWRRRTAAVVRGLGFSDEDLVRPLS